MPSWLLILFDEVSRRHPDVTDRWPNLAVLIHGGVAFAPYRLRFEGRLGRRLDRIEVYPASEGFVAVQTEASGGLTLMLDYGIFYEFVPVEDLGLGRPRHHTVADVELDRSYAILLTTPAGLWSYILGDTVRFTARDHHRARASLRERVRRERHRRGGRAGDGERVRRERRRGGRVHRGAPVSVGDGSPRRSRLDRRVPPAAARRPALRALDRHRLERTEHRLSHDAHERRRHDGAARAGGGAGNVSSVDANRREARRPAQGPARHEPSRPRRRAAGCVEATPGRKRPRPRSDGGALDGLARTLLLSGREPGASPVPVRARNSVTKDQITLLYDYNY